MARFLRIRGFEMSDASRNEDLALEDLVINVERIIYVGGMDLGAATVFYEGAGGQTITFYVDCQCEEFLEQLGLIQGEPTPEVWPKRR